MKKSFCFIATLFFLICHVDGQVCLTYDGSSLVQNNGNGTCTYDVTLIVDSGNGATGVATFSIDGSDVHVENDCTCNPLAITFPVTIICGSTVDINVFYNAPGNGNDCNGNSGAQILPVDWLSFDLNEEGNEIQLSWSTASELNNDYFQIERSADGRIWDVVSPNIEAVHYSNHINEYNYIDYRPNHGQNYYRVVQTDFDGNHSTSNTLGYFYEKVGSINVYPNPVADVLYIKTEALGKWNIYSLQGDLVKSGVTDQINTSDLNSGPYFIKIESANKTEHINFIKL